MIRAMVNNSLAGVYRMGYEGASAGETTCIPKPNFSRLPPNLA
jgi:hypothetical protein